MGLSPSEQPRLLYINGPWDHLGQRMRLSYVEPLQRLLERDFEVCSVATPCDLAAEAARHEPELIVFHTGCEVQGEPALVVTNAAQRRDIPRIAVVDRDPFSPSRAVAMQRIRDWEVDAVFTLTRPTDYLVAPLVGAIYLPHWIEPETFRDHGEPKTIALALTGAGWTEGGLYPWRRGIREAVGDSLPVVHVGSGGSHEDPHQYVGIEYARLLNRSWLAAGCGTFARYLTRKLLEIPAAGCCLVAEETEVLKALGFRDGENCLFATPETVLAKARAALADEPRLRAMTEAGHALVQRNHTPAQRRQFAEWHALWRRLRPGQRIVQGHPFEPLQLVDAEAPSPPWRFPTENPLNGLLLLGYRALAAGDPGEAAKAFIAQRGLAAWRAELRLGLAVCCSLDGDPAKAFKIQGVNIGWLLQWGGVHPDPVDQAFNAMLSLRLRDPEQAVRTLAACASVRHPALNAARWIVGRMFPALREANPVFAGAPGDETANTDTIHLLPARTFEEWVEWLLGQLRARRPNSDGGGEP